MAKPKQKYYVVWEGAKPGIYDDWDDCKAQIQGYPNARYKSFSSMAEAAAAYKGVAHDYIGGKAKAKVSVVLDQNPTIIADSLSVDCACSGVPGDMEYRGVYTKDKVELFHIGPYPQGTNNIGEFLAIVHGLAYLKQIGKHDMPVYSDSRNAIKWVRQKKTATTLQRNSQNARIFELIERAEKWLKNNTYRNAILKWETAKWGEIPADFGRK